MSTNIDIIYLSSPQVVTLQNVNLEAYSCEPVLATDGMNPMFSKVAISGTAIVTDEDWDAIRIVMTHSSQRAVEVRLNYPSATFPQPDLIRLESINSATGGPFVKLTGTQVAGGQLVLVRFEIEDQFAFCDIPLVSHVFRQSFAIDAKGYSTRTLTGSATAYRGATGTNAAVATNATWQTTRPYADLFRRLLIPGLPGPIGWRRESQQFDYDDKNLTLSYTIVDRQTISSLPDNVRVGDMEFSYERSLDNPGVAMLSLSCDLEAGPELQEMKFDPQGGAPTTPIRHLVKIAVALANTRINASFSTIIIQRMKITESEMLSGIKIRFELEAMRFPSGDPTKILPLANMIGTRFLVVRNIPAQPDVYGAPTYLYDPVAGGNPTPLGPYAMVPHWVGMMLNGFDCEDPDVPQATLVNASFTNNFGPVYVNVGVGDDGVDTMNSQFAGRYETAQNQPSDAEHDDKFYAQIIPHSRSNTTADYDSGIVRLSTMYTDQPDLVLQVRKPQVLVSEHVEIVQANKAPEKSFRPMPAQSNLTQERWSVAYGRFDAQGNRMFTGIYDRQYSLFDAGASTDNGFITQNNAYTGNVRAWNSPTQTFNPSLTPTATLASQTTTASVINTAGTAAEERYSVPTTTFVIA